MSDAPRSLEHEAVSLLRRHLEAGSEQTLHAAYELGRMALAANVGVMEMAALLLRAMVLVLRDAGPGAPLPREALEAFVLEAMSPFEMAHHGVREANQALRRLDEARESEMRRVAHELHDSAGQLLASVHLALDDLARDLDPRAAPGLERAQVLLVRVEEQLRRLSHEFRPPMLDDLGVGPALAYLCESIQQRTGLRVAARVEMAERLPDRLELAIYRFAQEGLANVVRHAHATRATVVIERGESEVTCRIEDDGVGFDPHEPGRGGVAAGIGLRGIRERTAGLGGSLEARSAPGQGTVLVLCLPLETGHVAAHSDRG